MHCQGSHSGHFKVEKNRQVYVCGMEIGAEMWHSEKSFGLTNAILINAQNSIYRSKKLMHTRAQLACGCQTANLKLRIANNINTNHVKQIYRLEILELVTDFGKHSDQNFHTLTRSGDTDSDKKPTNLYSQEFNISWSCSTVNTLHPGHSLILSLSSNAELVSKMSHFHFSVLPRLPQGILRFPLMSRLAQTSQDVLWFLLRMHPSQTSLCECSYFMECILLGQLSLHTVPSQTNLLKLSTILVNVPQCFWPESSFSNAIACINTYPVSFYCYMVGWLAGYWYVNCFLAVSQWKCITSWSTFRSDIMSSTAGMPNCFMGSTSAGCSWCVYLPWAHTGHQFLLWVSPPAHEERFKHWAFGIKNTKALGLLNDVGIYWCTSSYWSMLNNNISRYAQWSWSQETK